MSESREKGEKARWYVATEEELQAIDDAIASIDAGEQASDEEIEAAFAKFRPAQSR
jgi:hypothetical protein